MTGKPYIRKKGNKFVIEQKILVNGKQKTKYIKTLPPVERLLELLSQDAKDDKASQDEVDNLLKVSPKFAQGILKELPEDSNIMTLDEEDISKSLYEISK